MTTKEFKRAIALYRRMAGKQSLKGFKLFLQSYKSKVS